MVHIINDLCYIQPLEMIECGKNRQELVIYSLLALATEEQKLTINIFMVRHKVILIAVLSSVIGGMSEDDDFEDDFEDENDDESSSDDDDSEE